MARQNENVWARELDLDFCAARDETFCRLVKLVSNSYYGVRRVFTSRAPAPNQ
jgi:hypothetical protein